jgi:hypothetical protein
MSNFYVDNAMTWAHIRLRGGWRNILVVNIAYALIATGVIYLIVRFVEASGSPIAVPLEASSKILLAIQCLLLFVLAPMRVSASVRADFKSGIIESHRLMPLSPHGGTVGYILGSTTQTLNLYLVTLLVGAVTWHAAGGTQDYWFFANAVLLSTAIMLWGFSAALACIFSGGGFGAYFVLIAAIGFTRATVLIALPGLYMLFSPVIGYSVFMPVSHFSITFQAMLLAIPAQLALAAIFMHAVARKYGRADARAFPIYSALGILAIWTCVSIYGLQYAMQPAFSGLRNRGDLVADAMAQITSTLVASWILCIFVMASLVGSILEYNTKIRRGSSKPGFRPISPLVCGFVCLGLIVLQVIMEPPNAGRHGVQLVAAATAIFLVQIYFILRIFRPGAGGVMVIVAYIVFVWVMPFVGDTIYFSLTDPTGKLPMDHFSVISPIDAIVQAYGDNSPNTIYGLAIQGALAGATALVCALTRKTLPKSVVLAENTFPVNHA